MSLRPIFEVLIPEYKIPLFNDISEKMEYAGTPWFGIEIPKVYWDNKPDFEKIGAKIDKCLKQHFLDKKVAVRVLSSEDHDEKTIDDLIKIICDIGHDRYDSDRVGDRYENIDMHHIDFFALDFIVNENEPYFKDFIEPFYFWPLSVKEKPVRIDIAIVYDYEKLKVVEHRYKGRENELKKDAFIFKHPDNKTDAILGIIKIL